VFKSRSERPPITARANSTVEGEDEFWLFKIDKGGTLLWNKIYGGSERQKAIALAKAGDGYLIVGDTHLSSGAVEALLIKTVLDGNRVW
jgi:hypothetical protein